jgi:ribosome maturation protein Sdo1
MRTRPSYCISFTPIMTHGKSSQELEQCSYRHENDMSRTEFYLYCQPGMVKQWRTDKSTPLVQVVQSFEIFCSESGGHTGYSMRPSKQQLVNYFGTDDVHVIIPTILEKGSVSSFSGHIRHNDSISTKR